MRKFVLLFAGMTLRVIAMFLLLLSSSHAFQQQHSLKSISYCFHELGETEQQTSLVILKSASASQDAFAAKRVAERVGNVFQRAMEKEQKAREEAERLAAEVRRAEEALRLAEAEATAAKELAKLVDTKQSSKVEGWADKRVQSRIQSQAERKARAEQKALEEAYRRARVARLANEAREKADAAVEAKMAKADREEWANDRVQARLRLQAEKKAVAREELIRLEREARSADEARMRAAAEQAVQQAKRERSIWANRRVDERLKGQARKKDALERKRQEEALRLAIETNTVAPADNLPKVDAELASKAAKAERAKWAAERVMKRRRQTSKSFFFASKH